MSMINDLIKDVEIVEFQSKYESGVIDLIDSILKELKVIEDGPVKIDDEDLFKIPQVYSGKGKFWIALKNGIVIGTVAIRDLGDNSAKLNRMFVTPDYRGTGLGQKLLDTALDFARLQGFKEVSLNTHILMERAHHFYEKNGFKRTDLNHDKYSYRLIL